MFDLPQRAMSEAPRRLFCFGLGYSALALADALLVEGWSIAGTCHTAETLAALRDRGIAAHLFERGRPLAQAVLDSTTHLLQSIPPDEEGDPVLGVHGATLAQLPQLRWFGYLSTTGVYGDRAGDWVDEHSDLQPTGERGRRRVAAEVGWSRLAHGEGLPLHVFRLAGIYGPGRSALDSLRAGTARRVIKPGQVFSRIHVADIVQVLRASMARPNSGAVYNVCDDDPAPPWEVIEHAAELLGIPPPPAVPFERAQLSDMARSFYDDNKRVRNDRIKQELGVQLRYSSYRAGLQALFASHAGGDVSKSV
jgi:nucleoside-diphosphate-sugar epimerase